MLRNVLIAVGIVSILCGLIALATGFFPPAAIFGFWGVLLVLGILFERVAYKPIEKSNPGPGWVRTPERFVDDATGATVTVYIEPKTGKRVYVQE